MLKIKQETIANKIKSLKKTKTYDKYSDSFNKLVCETADRMEISLPSAETLLKENITDEIKDSDLEDYLFNKYKTQTEDRLRKSLVKNICKFSDIDKVISFTSLFFEIEQIKTDDIWGFDKFENIIISGLEGEKVNFITMLCLINDFDNNGGYTPNPNLFAYIENPKLEPIPLIVEEIVLIKKLFAFYNIESTLTIFVSDTDYTEIGQFGPANKLGSQNIQKYISNLRDFLTETTNVEVMPISNLTDNSSIYLETKNRVLNNVNGFKDPEFTSEWYQKFENDFEKISESQGKRKLFPPNEIRKKSLDILRNIWACNAAQGAVFGGLGNNTVLISTERRERDKNYTINKDSRRNFPPVLYILKAAEIWNRKITAKEI